MIKRIRQRLSAATKRVSYLAGASKNYIPPVGRVWLGDMKRTTPFSKKFGSDRGGPIDRYYIKKFLRQESDSIQGRVLEIGESSYSREFGSDNITKIDILHVDESNKEATFIGDLSNAPHIPDNTFDCFVLIQTLHLIYDFKEALRTCYRILKPGGVLLLTVPGITPIDYHEWGYTWYWSFTDMAMKKVIAETFPESSFEVNNYGNVLSASAFLYGMGQKELSAEQLDVHDPNMQVSVTVKAVKKARI